MTNLHKIFRVIYPAKEPNEIIREYNVPRVLNLQIRLTNDGWFVATVPELPGLITQAQSQQELLHMVNDAVLTYFDVPKRDADIVYDKMNINGMEVQYNAQLKTA
jgi:predicted RNase H-like HicB family nuclease